MNIASSWYWTIQWEDKSCIVCHYWKTIVQWHTKHLAFEASSCDRDHLISKVCLYNTSRKVAGLLQLIQRITHTWSVSALCQSGLFQQKMFSYCIVVLEKHRNTLPNNSEDRFFVPQTYSHCQCYGVSLHVQLVTYYTKVVTNLLVPVFIISGLFYQ